MASPKLADLPVSVRTWMRSSRGPIATHLQLTDTPMPSLPAPDSDEVLVRVGSVSLEYSMSVIIASIPALPFIPALVPELCFSGTVVAAGSRAPSDVREAGTRVVGFQDPPVVMLRGGGVLREYVRISGHKMARIPDSMAGATGLDHAAALLGPGTTADKMLRTAGVKAGDRVLVNGASGAVGNMLVQLARGRGARVVGVASGRNEAFVRGVGADEFVDYTAHTGLTAHLAAQYGATPFDHVLDCVGDQRLYDASPTYLKPAGTVINVGAMNGMVMAFVNWFQNAWRPVWLGGTPRHYFMFSTIPSRDDLMLVLKMVENGQLKVNLDSVWPMQDAVKGYERVASKRSRGKVVVRVQEDA